MLLMKKQYCGFLVNQRGEAAPKFCIFYAPVREILDWALIVPLGHKTLTGVQRKAVPSRIKGIKRYFETDQKNIIPTAVIIAFAPRSVLVRDIDTRAKMTNTEDANLCNALIQLELSWDADNVTGLRDSRPGYVVDGQHRLKGIQEYDPNTPIPVVGILESDDNETAFQFLVINNKQSKVPPDHVRALAFLSKIDDRNLESRLKSARLSLNPNYESVGFADTDTDSPFKGQIKWPPNPEGSQLVVPTAIEWSIQYIRRRGGRDLEEPEQAQAFFLAIWTAVKTEWGELWNENTHLLQKVSIICLTQFITDTLVTWARNPRFEVILSDDEIVKENVQAILNELKSDFFAAKWSGSSYDTGAGRDLIVEAIEIMHKNAQDDEPWYKDIKVLDKDWLDQYTASSS